MNADRTGIYHVRVANEMAEQVAEYACAIEALVLTTSRWRAVQVLRASGVGGFSSRDLRRVRVDEIQDGPPLEFEVVVSRPVYVDGAWERRRR